MSTIPPRRLVGMTIAYPNDLIKCVAGGGSRQFNHFHAELTTRGDLFAAKAAHGLVRDDDVDRSESTLKLDKPPRWATRSYGSG